METNSPTPEGSQPAVAPLPVEGASDATQRVVQAEGLEPITSVATVGDVVPAPAALASAEGATAEAAAPTAPPTRGQRVVDWLYRSGTIRHPIVRLPEPGDTKREAFLKGLIRPPRLPGQK